MCRLQVFETSSSSKFECKLLGSLAAFPRKGKERKGKERKGKERKGKERKKGKAFEFD